MLSPHFQAFIWEKLRFRSATEVSPGQSISCVLMVNLIYVILEHDIGCLANTMSVTCELTLTLRVPLQCVLLTIPSLLLHCCLLLPTSTCSPSLPPSSPCFFPPAKLPLYVSQSTELRTMYSALVWSNFCPLHLWPAVFYFLPPLSFCFFCRFGCHSSPHVAVVLHPALPVLRTMSPPSCLLAASTRTLIPLHFPLCWPVLTKAPVWNYTY